MRDFFVMVQFSLHLPARYRIDLHLIKIRKSQADPLLPDLSEIFQTKKGNKLSRYFRHIFEHKNIKKIIGSNLILFSFALTAVPVNSAYIGNSSQQTIELPIVVNTQSGVQYPVEAVSITQGYRFYHPAVDFDGVTGDLIRPIMAGVVENTQNSLLGYGKSVLVNHGGDIKTLYAHLSEINVKKGQEITKETIIGKMGATGRAFGDHLHFEIIENDKNINPQLILPKI